MENKKEWINFLTEKAKFKLTPEEIERFEKDLSEFQEQLKTLDNFDLSNVEPMRAPFEVTENELRDDSNVVNNSEIIVENASNSKDNYILLKKEDK